MPPLLPIRNVYRQSLPQVCSTEKMVHYCKDPSDTFIILTETGMMHRLTRELPEKAFVAGPTEIVRATTVGS